MSWRDRYRQASFRGVEFFVARAVGSHGRDIVVHKFPQRETPSTEDVGRSAREFSIDGYLIGDDYDIQLDKLIRACERPNVGYPTAIGSTLIHPYRGTLKVVCTGIRTDESEETLRFARVRMSFIEAGDIPKPNRVSNPQGQAEAAGAALEVAAATAASEPAQGLQVQGVPAVVTESLAADTESLGKTLANLNIFTGLASDVAAQAASIKDLVANASSLATSPVELVVAVQLAISGVSASVANALGALFAYEAVLDLVFPSSPDPTSTVEEIQAENANLFRGLVDSSALAGAVTSAAAVSWASVEDALEVRNRLADRINQRAADASDLEGPALDSLRSALVASVPPIGSDLPSLDEVTLEAAIPAILLAYRLYDSPDRDSDIVERNNPRHESFLPAGEPLEVLSR